MNFLTLTYVDGSQDVINFQHVISFTKWGEHTRLYFNCPVNEEGDTYYDVQETPAAIMIEMHRVKMFNHKLELMAAEEHKADKKK